MRGWAVNQEKPSRQRLTQAEWDAELAKAAEVQAKDVERFVNRPGRRRRSWWQRGWRR